MKKLICSLLIVLCCTMSFAQKLQFKENGTFKIVQFTDLHYIYQDQRSEVTLKCIEEVMGTEKPDLVILTGDVIYGKPADKSLKTVLDKLSEYHIPFAITFGNHDDEQGMSRSELFEIIKSYPLSLTQTTDGIAGITNYVLPVADRKGENTVAALYCFDSHSYSQIKGVGGYDYIKADQIEWYKNTSKGFSEKNQGNPLPSLAFFHIALPEYHEAVQSESTGLIGIRKEKVCSPELNSGLFTAMKEMNDVRGVFVGHDHDNDYAAYWKGILLAYGRYSGGNTVYNNLPSGARVIELQENQTTFKTWIHQYDGKVLDVATCPDSFLKKD